MRKKIKCPTLFVYNSILYVLKQNNIEPQVQNENILLISIDVRDYDMIYPLIRDFKLEVTTEIPYHSDQPTKVYCSG